MTDRSRFLPAALTACLQDGEPERAPVVDGASQCRVGDAGWCRPEAGQEHAGGAPAGVAMLGQERGQVFLTQAGCRGRRGIAAQGRPD